MVRAAGRPDEDHDVIVHQFRQLGVDGAGRDIWTIWLAGDKQGERTTLEAAIELACDVALVYSRPAWLLDETGYPLKPIECRLEAAVDRAGRPDYMGVSRDDATPTSAGSASTRAFGPSTRAPPSR